MLAELKQKGLIRHIGLSNVTPAQLAEAQADHCDCLRTEPLQRGASEPTMRSSTHLAARGHRLRSVLSAWRVQPAAVGYLV